MSYGERTKYYASGKPLKPDAYGGVKCIHCDEGYRHPMGNCVCCGCGPAPGAVEVLPQNEQAREYAVDVLAAQLRPAFIHQQDQMQRLREHFRREFIAERDGGGEAK